MKLDGRISILGSEDEVKISIHDNNANCLLAEVVLTPEDFVHAALGRLAYMKCIVETGPIEHIGKQMILDKMEFEVPEEIEWNELRDWAKEKAVEECPSGWVPDQYFGSQNSFFSHDGKRFARTTIRKWVDNNE